MADLLSLRQFMQPRMQSGPTLRQLMSEQTFQGVMEKLNRDPYRRVGSLTGPPTTQFMGGPILDPKEFLPTPTSVAWDIAGAALPPGVRLAGKGVKAVRALRGAGISPKVLEAEKLLKLINPKEEKILYHSGTADIDESIRQNWLRPQVGRWVREVLEGATDNPETIEELTRRGAVYMSDTPTWVRAKVAQAAGKHVKDVTDADIRKFGQLTMIRTSKDAPIVRKLEEDDFVESLRGQKMRWWESPLYDYDVRREIPFGVERGDYFAVEDIEPTLTLTGENLMQFLSRNPPKK